MLEEDRSGEVVTSRIHDKIMKVAEKEDVLFNLAFSVESTGKSYPEITPHTFAFNTIEGMCPECQGLGYQYGANLTQKKELMDQSIAALVRFLWLHKYHPVAFATLEIFLQTEGIDMFSPLRLLPMDKLQLLMNGSGETWMTSPLGFKFRWIGINHVLAKAGKNAKGELRDAIIPLLEELECMACQGSRLSPLGRHVTINKLSIYNLCLLPMEQALQFIETIQLSSQDKKLLEEVRSQLINRLRFLCTVGLQYISLHRRAPTLSGGETQRIRLARQLGSGLTGVLYVLDEPTIGLHPHDNERLNQALQQLKELDNTLILVEHDPLTIATADYILDFGPQAGQQGGHITAQGTLKQILRNPKSLTGLYLSGKLTLPIPECRRSMNKGFIQVQNAHTHNLKNISVEIPVSALTCLTGVSGSGKSTLMHQVLLPAVEKGLLTSDNTTIDGTTISGILQFDRLLSIDQNPIGHTVRSDVCTYVDVLTRIREFFASLPLARIRGLQPKHFSYNHRKGMCTACWGLGYRRIQMYFLPPIKVVCEDCKGMRLNPVSLEVLYDGKNLGQYLDSTVDEARVAFQNHPRIIRILDTLISVGLGYLKLGQEMASLSGGEAQRIKLSRELSKRSTGKTLYLLDEPTTGLHSDDIKKLLVVLQKLVNKGNTMIIIEHNLDIIKNADYIIDLGPDAGMHGGAVVCEGTPEEVAEHPTSWTAKGLKEVLT